MFEYFKISPVQTALKNQNKRLNFNIHGIFTRKTIKIQSLQNAAK